VEVDEHGKRRLRFSINGNEEAEPELPRGVDFAVEGFDAADGGCGGSRFDVGDAYEAAIDGAITAASYAVD